MSWLHRKRTPFGCGSGSSLAVSTASSGSLLCSRGLPGPLATWYVTQLYFFSQITAWMTHIGLPGGSNTIPRFADLPFPHSRLLQLVFPVLFTTNLYTLLFSLNYRHFFCSLEAHHPPETWPLQLRSLSSFSSTSVLPWPRITAPALS